jgi:hypothetical protein
MEKKLEDTLRKALDKLLQSTLEKRYYRLMDDVLLDLIESKRDFLFGVVVGDMLEGLGFCTYGAYKRYPKDEEFRGLFKIIHSRAEGIREKVDSLLTE